MQYAIQLANGAGVVVRTPNLGAALAVGGEALLRWSSADCSVLTA